MVSFSLTGRPLFVLAARADSPTPRRRMTSALTLAASVGVPLGLGQVIPIFNHKLIFRAILRSYLLAVGLLGPKLTLKPFAMMKILYLPTFTL